MCVFDSNLMPRSPEAVTDAPAQSYDTIHLAEDHSPEYAVPTQYAVSMAASEEGYEIPSLFGEPSQPTYVEALINYGASETTFYAVPLRVGAASSASAWANSAGPGSEPEYQYAQSFDEGPGGSVSSHQKSDYIQVVDGPHAESSM
jgi:hypothetical protein